MSKEGQPVPQNERLARALKRALVITPVALGADAALQASIQTVPVVEAATANCATELDIVRNEYTKDVRVNLYDERDGKLIASKVIKPHEQNVPINFKARPSNTTKDGQDAFATKIKYDGEPNFVRTAVANCGKSAKWVISDELTPDAAKKVVTSASPSSSAAPAGGHDVTPASDRKEDQIFSWPALEKWLNEHPWAPVAAAAALGGAIGASVLGRHCRRPRHDHHVVETPAPAAPVAPEAPVAEAQPAPVPAPQNNNEQLGQLHQDMQDLMQGINERDEQLIGQLQQLNQNAQGNAQANIEAARQAAREQLEAERLGTALG